MPVEPVIDLTQPRLSITARGITRFHIFLFALTIMIVLADGYDVVCIAYVAPVLLKEWHFSPASQGLLFGSGFLGGMAGPPLFGYLADRLGRKYTTIFGTAFFGLFTDLPSVGDQSRPIDLAASDRGRGHFPESSPTSSRSTRNTPRGVCNRPSLLSASSASPSAGWWRASSPLA